MGRISRRAFHGALASALAWSALPKAWAIPNRPTSVALLLSGVITDGGWSQLAYNGLKELKTRGFKTAYAENISIAQMDQVTRGYSDDGFDLVVGHGVEFSSTLLEVAPDYPAQHYFVTTFLPQPEVPANIMYVNMGYFGAAYGAGVLAALISDKKRAVGFIGGDDDPNQNHMKKAFIAGAQRTVPGIQASRLSQVTTTTHPRAARLLDPDWERSGCNLARGGRDRPWRDPRRGRGERESSGLLFGSERPCAQQHGDQLRDEPGRNGNQPSRRRWLTGAFAGGNEWRPPVNQMWLQKCGQNGEYNPRLISADEWNAFQKVWSDIASHKIDVDAVGGVSSRRLSASSFSDFFNRHLSEMSIWRLLGGACGEPYPGNEKHRQALSGRLANNNVSLTIRAGEIHALLGENGAGKSTLMQILYGFHAMDSGEICIDGQAVRLGSPKDAIALGIGMVHQEFMLVRRFSVVENTVLGLREGRGPFLDLRRASEKLKELSNRHGLSLEPAAEVGSLPIGVQQRVEILKLLYRDARLLILDEPTAVLTPQEKDQLFAVLRKLRARRPLRRIGHAQAQRNHGNCRSRNRDARWTSGGHPRQSAQHPVRN